MTRKSRAAYYAALEHVYVWCSYKGPEGCIKAGRYSSKDKLVLCPEHRKLSRVKLPRLPLKEQLSDLLAAALGFPVHPDDLVPNKGGKAQDVYRWEATIAVPPDRDEEYRVNDDPSKPWKRVFKDVFGMRQDHVMLFSWDSMTDCVKNGIDLNREDWAVEVSAKSKPV